MPISTKPDKIKERELRPASEWVQVSDSREAIIARQNFDLVQRIHRLDTRTAPEKDTVYLFSGVLICGGRMTRKTNRRNGREYHYYYCPTGKKNGCGRPVMAQEQRLTVHACAILKAYIDNVVSLEALLSSVDRQKINQALAKKYSGHLQENRRRLEEVSDYKARLYESLVNGIVTREDYYSFRAKYSRQAEEIQNSIQTLEEKLEDVMNNRSEEKAVVHAPGKSSEHEKETTA